MSVLDLVRAAPKTVCRPQDRHVLPAETWHSMASALGTDPIRLLGLWADTTQVHVLFQHGEEMALASVAVEDGQYPALSGARPAAARFERMIHDLWGHTAHGAIDDRTWLDHGRWPLAHPQSPRPGLPGGAVDPPAFPALDESGLMQVPLGPIHGGVEEPAHLRLAVQGAVIRNAEGRLGYAHKGILALMQGKSPRAAARFVARMAAEATVAHSVAFARAAEAALDVPVPPRAAALRAVLLEHEQITGWLDNLGRMAEAVGLAGLHTACGRHLEQWRRAAEAAFGHRLLMDVVAPGGVACDIVPDGPAVLHGCADALIEAWPGLQRQIEALAARLPRPAAFSARPGALSSWPALSRPSMPHRGNIDGRLNAGHDDIAAGLRQIAGLVAALPDGPISASMPAESGEGIGSARSVRGEVWHWLRLHHGQIAAAFPLDPGWALWPAAEAAMIGHTVEEAALIRLSYGLPVSGLDL